MRASSLIQTDEDTTILIDCSPDFREQMLPFPFKKIDGVLITHEHYDHVGGLDDLRPFNRFGDIPVYTEDYTADCLRTRIPYCFAKQKYPGIPYLFFKVIEINHSFHINRTEILPLRVMHGKLPIAGFRIQNMAYITDMLTMPDDSFEKLKGIDVLILNALRIKPHHSHQTISEALETAKRIAAKDTYFIHLSHQAGLHDELQKSLPEHVHLTFDGMVITT
jgi:phosphoribosyl 1,2-cyclic phosphate phosphodiesterase